VCVITSERNWEEAAEANTIRAGATVEMDAMVK